jgi:hypothetical protein
MAAEKERRPQMEERRKDQETRNDEVRFCATPSDQGFDQCGKSKTSEKVCSRERSLKKAPGNPTRRSFWTEYTPRPAAHTCCNLQTDNGTHEDDTKENDHDKSSFTRESVSESI